MNNSCAGFYFDGCNPAHEEKTIPKTCAGEKFRVDTLYLRQIPNCVSHLVRNGGQKIHQHSL